MIGLLKAKGQHQRGRRFSAAALSALLLISSAQTSAHAAVSYDIAADPVTTANIPIQAPIHERREELVREGWEGIELAARLHEFGGLISRPVHWTVRRSLIDEGRSSELILRQSAPVIDTPLEPGDYLIEAEYGFHKVTEAVSIKRGHRIGLTLILNVGGIRALSKLDKLDVPNGISAHHAIYALSGPDAGKPIATSRNQGDVLRLGAGRYRIESRFSPGNTIAEHTVTVKPGLLSSMELAHQAGLARITVGTSLEGAVAWEVRKLDGTWMSGHTTPEAALVLAPGAYEVVAIVNGGVQKQRFSIKAGENRHIRLGFGS